MAILVEQDSGDWLSAWLDDVDPEGVLSRRTERGIGVNCLNDGSGQGHLSLGLPSTGFRTDSMTARHVFWFPHGLPAAKSLLLASSRLGHQPETKPGIFDAIRTLACHFDPQQYFLITHGGIATDRYVSRAAELFQIPLVRFMPFPPGPDSAWFRSMLDLATRQSVCFYLPMQAEAAVSPDRLLMSIADEVRLLSVSNKGNILTAAEIRLGLQTPVAKTWLVMDGTLTELKTANHLVTAGASPWFLFSDTDANQATAPIRMAPVHELTGFSNQHCLGDYLIHWTRRRIGPWPDQSVDQFLDDLILGLHASDHSRIATLCRILAMGRLIADKALIRAAVPMVCFSACCVDQLMQRRRFRPHLGRWDFETVGIAIRRQWLADTGARAVIYGDDATWETLSEPDRPYFQVTGSTSGHEGIDWTAEQEWRVMGNVDLNRMRTDDAFVYVQTRAEGQVVAPLSRWPVVVLEE